MELIYRGYRYALPSALVVQCAPQCRTVLSLSGYSFVSLPYTIFLIGHSCQLYFRWIYAFFSNLPVLSTGDALSLTCFPNCSSTGVVCLPMNIIGRGGSEKALIKSAIGAFWTTRFDGPGPRILCLDHGIGGLDQLARATETDRGIGLKIDWRRESGRDEDICLDSFRDFAWRRA